MPIWLYVTSHEVLSSFQPFDHQKKIAKYHYASAVSKCVVLFVQLSIYNWFGRPLRQEGYQVLGRELWFSSCSD